jgi:hypothetical protein
MKIMNDGLLVVTVREVHHWPTCPCSKCEQERAKRTPSGTHVKRISPEAAHILRFIPARSPHGSLARELMLSEKIG